jgi:hypothetical protein
LIKGKPGFSGKMFWTLDIPFKTGFTVIAYTILAENSVGQIQLGSLEVDGRMMLKFIVREYDINLWTEFVCLRTRTKVWPF